jgi:WD40 repeat protein
LIVYRVAVSSKGNRVYSGSADNTAKVWSIDATAAAKAES